MNKIKETKFTGSVFRIQRKILIDKIGFGEGQYFESRSFYDNLKKHGLKGAITNKHLLAASQFRTINKGYPAGFTEYRTYNPIKEKILYGEHRHNNPYVPKTSVYKRANRGIEIKD